MHHCRASLACRPQAVCSQYGLAVGSYSSLLVRFLIIVCWPIGKPLVVTWVDRQGPHVCLADVWGHALTVHLPHLHSSSAAWPISKLLDKMLGADHSVRWQVVLLVLMPQSPATCTCV